MKPNTHLNAAIIESVHYVHLKIIVTDNNMESVKIISRNKYQHEENEKNPTTRLPSPIRRTVADHVKYG